MTTSKTILKWGVPAAAFLIQAFYVLRIEHYGIKIGLHWLLYILLFIYLCVFGDIKQLLQKMKHGMTGRRFSVWALLCFGIAFCSVIAILVFFSTFSDPIYPLWQPFSPTLLFLWIPLYVVIQVMVDHIIFYKWFLNEGASGNKIFIILVIVLRTFLETGVLVLSKDTPLQDASFLALALYCANTVFVLCYFKFRDESLSFVAEALFRFSMVITVLVGMPQILPFFHS